MEPETKNNTAAFIHLSSLAQYVIPFGNFILPLILWTSNKHKSEYIDQQGKEVINFQLSLFLYSILLCAFAIPTLIYTFLTNASFSAVANKTDFVLENFSLIHLSGIAIIAIVALLLFVFLKTIEFVLIIYAFVQTANGNQFKYPLSIPFIK